MRHGKGLSALLLLTPRQKANEFNNMPTYRFDCQRQHFRCGASTLKHVPRPTTGTSTLKLKQRRRENVDYNSWSTFVSSLYSLQLAHAKCRFPQKFTPMSLHGRHSHVVIMGDFNYPEIDWIRECSNVGVNHQATKFMEGVRDTFMHQHVICGTPDTSQG